MRATLGACRPPKALGLDVLETLLASAEEVDE
jgi:hypothetical protein